MSAKNSNEIVMSKKRRSLRSALGVVALSTAFLLSVGMNKSEARIIDSVTEDFGEARTLNVSSSKGGAACNKLENATSPVRAGRRAFKHLVNNCGERSEFSMDKTTIGSTYWYGWSVFIPSDWQDSSSGFDILNQWATWPTKREGNFPCGANGSYMVMGRNSLQFKLQRQGDSADMQCNSYNIADLNAMRGKWVDFVMQAKWTGNSDGFVKLWMKIGDADFVEKVNYTGRTYWNDEGAGPYFKMGVYKGDPNFSGPSPRSLYTDEYRLGDANSSFQEVAPGGSAMPSNSSIRVEAENMSVSAYRIESENSAASNGGLISLRNAPSSTDTASSAFSGNLGKYDVYLGYFDENDGVGNLQVSVGGVRLADTQLNQGLGANRATAETLVRKKVAGGLSINKGARIEIKGTANREEWACVDYIEFVSAP